MYEYSGQIRRFITQFIRIVSNFEVEFGTDENGLVTRRVPVLYGDPSRQVAQILQNNSENTLNAVPAMAVYVTGLEYDRERVQEPALVQKSHVRQREFDSVTGTYTQKQGNAYTIERLMPVPYRLKLKLDIWTSSTEHKLQLLEQIAPMFNPAFEIQNTDQYFDWTSLTAVFLTDTTWDSRSVPVGQSEAISIATMSFDLPIWISTAAKVKKLGVIHKVITDLSDLQDLSDLGTTAITLYNFGVVLEAGGVDNYNLKLVRSSNIVANEEFVIIGDPIGWEELLNQYGKFVPGISKVRLSQPDGSEIIGTITDIADDPYSLTYLPDVDTLPANTVGAIDAIVDPENIDVDGKLVNPVAGTRYMILKDIGAHINIDGAIAWRGSNGSDLIAHENDIIEYNGVEWTVSFSSSGVSSIEYVTNLTTGIQYKWEPEESTWIQSFIGVYRAGQWSLEL